MSSDLPVRSVNIVAGTMSARVPLTLVDVVRAIWTREARCTRALVAVLERATLGPVSTRRRGAVILSLAMITWKKKRNDVVQRLAPMHILVKYNRKVARFTMSYWELKSRFNLKLRAPDAFTYFLSDFIFFYIFLNFYFSKIRNSKS